MSLEQDIQDQYRSRVNTEALYNSDYSKRAEQERYRKMRKLVKRFRIGGTVLEIGAGQGNNVPLLEYCGFTKISLNEVKRRKEMEEADLKRGQEKIDTKLVGKDQIPMASDLNDVDDEYLREGLFILSDLITSKIG